MSLDHFFNPRSVAVVGASREKGKAGYEILVNLVKGGFPGKVFPVNPKADQIEGLRCYPNLKAIGETPDLVVVVVPTQFVPDVIQECGAVGVKAVVIITAGFKEVGEEGRKLERTVAELAKKAGIRMIGPNCLGVMSTTARMNASFGSDLPAAGGIGYMSQSGALLAAILDLANASALGFSKLISMGNKADVNEMDLIQALGRDPETRVIAGYLENIIDGAAFVKIAEEIAKEKPILLMKSGGTKAGAKAASSHTGSLVGSETSYVCAFQRTGMIRCSSIQTQFDYAMAFADQPLPAGNRVVVITNAGGPGIMAADAVEREGLVFARLSPETKAKLAPGLPPAANIHNPIDVLGDALADRYGFALATAIEDPKVDIALVLLTPQAMTECEKTAEAVVRCSKANPRKPVLTSFLGRRLVAEANRMLRAGKIPTYESPEAAVATIRAMTDYVKTRSRPLRVIRSFPADRERVKRIIQEHLDKGRREIGEKEGKEILEAYGFATPQGGIAASADEAAAIADRIGYPVVAKIWSPDIIHKSDVGGVKVGLADPRQVREAFETMMREIAKKQPAARLSGVFVQQMCGKGQEVIFGVSRDPQFGPLIMFGLGGTMVEVLKDVAFRLAPLSEDDAREMMTGIRAYQILLGARGQPGVDTAAIVEGLQRVSQLVMDFPEISEMDVNPFVVMPGGKPSVAVDARISVEKDREIA